MRRQLLARLEELEEEARQESQPKQQAARPAGVPDNWHVIHGQGVVVCLPPNGREGGTQ